MIRVEHVTKQFGNFKALDDASLHIEKGSIYGLVGPNGAGKSTIIRHLTGVYRPDAGTITIAGEPVYENSEIKQRIAFIPDDVFYFTQADTLEMKRFFESMYQDFDAALFDELNTFFPEIDTKCPVRKLSKGMQKQVAFWLSVCTQPEVLILDEPVDGLDPVMRRQIWSIILNQAAEKDTTVLVSSHNLRELEDVCDHVGILHHGHMVLERSLEDLQNGIFKLQIAMPEGQPSLPENEFKILHASHIGRVHTLIVRGDADSAQQYLADKGCLLMDILPLTLEEIFIYEMGGMNYEIKNLVL